MVKLIAGINHYRKRIGTIDKDDVTAVCHACSENEDWEHFALWEKNKDKREELKRELEIKIKNIEQHKNADAEEKFMVQEMLKDANKYCNMNKN